MHAQVFTGTACGLRKEWELFFQWGDGHIFSRAYHKGVAGQPLRAHLEPTLGWGLSDRGAVLRRPHARSPEKCLPVNSYLLWRVAGRTLQKVFISSLPKCPAPPPQVASWVLTLAPATLKCDCRAHSSVGWGRISCLKGRGWTCLNPAANLAPVPGSKRLFW